MLTRAPSALRPAKARTPPKPRPRPNSRAAFCSQIDARFSQADARSFQAGARPFRAAALFLFAVALCAALSSVGAFARGQAQRTEAPATVTGRVTDGEHGLAGVAIVLVSGDTTSPPRPVAHAKTDDEGNYRLTGVPPGRYKIIPFSPTYIVQGMSMFDYPPGKPLNLSAGESVEGIDFRLERGGVITGRVTDADGNPVISEPVSVVPYASNEQQRQLLQQQQQMQRGPFDVRDYTTDDRGVYRVYGLLPGTYHVSAGQDGDNGALTYGRRKLYRRTFYNGAPAESQASTVEVTAGGETGDIDITLGRAVKTFRASGRFVSAETGQPVANVNYGYGPVRADGRFAGGFGGGFTTNERGEFQTDGLAPGHYAIFNATFGAAPNNAGDFYSDPVTFEVVDSDVNDIVVKLRRGATVSGVVTIEGADAATAARLLSGVSLYGVPQPTGASAAVMPNISRSLSVAADGTFRLAGLREGRLRIFLAGGRKGLTLARVELNGANVTNGFEVGDGAQVSGVRVVVAYGSGVIRGQVNFTNGAPPSGARVYIFAHRAGAEENNGGWAEVDARGRFVMENLPAGEYEVQARVMVFQPGARPAMSESQHVSLSEGGDMSVTLTVDVNAPPKGGRP